MRSALRANAWTSSRRYCSSGMQRVRTVPARAGAPMETGGDHLPHPHLLAHVFQMTGFTWEYLGSREDFGYRDAQKTPRSPNTPEHGHHKKLVPHGTHRDLPPEYDRSGPP